MDNAIKRKAEELSCGAFSHRKLSQRIANFVRDRIYYCLDEWNVTPSEVLAKGRGMCAGKALLTVEMHRALKMLSRFNVLKVLGEEEIFSFMVWRLEGAECSDVPQEDKEKVVHSIHSLPPYRDHIVLQVFLDDEWVDVDVARDKELDFGMRVLGIWKERKIISEEGPFDSIDRWLEERMQRRTVLQDRDVFFRVINHQIEKIRLAGKMTLKTGVKIWRDVEIKK